MIETSELQLTAEDHDEAFIEVCFLLDMFVETIEQFVSEWEQENEEGNSVLSESSNN